MSDRFSYVEDTRRDVTMYVVRDNKYKRDIASFFDSRLAAASCAKMNAKHGYSPNHKEPT